MMEDFTSVGYKVKPQKEKGKKRKKGPPPPPPPKKNPLCTRVLKILFNVYDYKHTDAILLSASDPFNKNKKKCFRNMYNAHCRAELKKDYYTQVSFN